MAAGLKDAKSLPTWLSVSPTTGTGTTDVTISVTDNIRDGALDNNRKYTIVFKGGTDASESPMVVLQEGDKYRDIPNSSVSQVVAMDDDAVVIVPDAQVLRVRVQAWCLQTGLPTSTHIATPRESKWGTRLVSKVIKILKIQFLSYLMWMRLLSRKPE